MIIKKGDKVLIKSWSQMEIEFGLDSLGDVNCNQLFTTDMKKEGYCGMILTAEADQSKDFNGDSFFTVKETADYYFSIDMVAEVINA